MADDFRRRAASFRCASAAGFVRSPASGRRPASSDRAFASLRSPGRGAPARSVGSASVAPRVGCRAFGRRGERDRRREGGGDHGGGDDRAELAGGDGIGSAEDVGDLPLLADALFQLEAQLAGHADPQERDADLVDAALRGPGDDVDDLRPRHLHAGGLARRPLQQGLARAAWSSVAPKVLRTPESTPAGLVDDEGFGEVAGDLLGGLRRGRAAELFGSGRLAGADLEGAGRRRGESACAVAVALAGGVAPISRGRGGRVAGARRGAAARPALRPRRPASRRLAACFSPPPSACRRRRRTSRPWPGRRRAARRAGSAGGLRRPSSSAWRRGGRRPWSGAGREGVTKASVRPAAADPEPPGLAIMSAATTPADRDPATAEDADPCPRVRARSTAVLDRPGDALAHEPAARPRPRRRTRLARRPRRTLAPP